MNEIVWRFLVFLKLTCENTISEGQMRFIASELLRNIDQTKEKHTIYCNISDRLTKILIWN